MHTSDGQQRNGVEEVDYWVKYIDCALSHPRPLPSGTHAFNATHTMKPEIRDLYQCLYKLYTEESCSVPFREPVNALTLGVFTYYDSIKRPMSLRDVLDRIATGSHYSTVAQVEENVDLIWQNCATFNGPTSPITAASKKCAGVLQDLRRRQKEDAPASDADVGQIFDLFNKAEGDEVSEALIAYFRKADPARLVNGELDLANLQQKHVQPTLDIIGRFVSRA